MQQTSVVIIGAGISGLALAQALHHRKIDFRLFERDPSLHARAQGYRVRISEPGIDALERSLSANHFSRLQTVCPPAEDGIGNASRMHLDANSAEPTESPFQRDLQNFTNKSISTMGRPLVADRSVLRQVLSEGVRDSLCFGVEYERHEEVDDGVIVHFKDQTAIRSHVLVGSDGLWSKVRRQLLPNYTLCDTGGRLVYGKTILSETMLAEFNSRVLQNPGLCLLRDAPQGLNCLLEPMRFDRTETALPEDYIYWVFFMPRSGEIDDETLMKLGGRQLLEHMQRLTCTWHPTIRCLFDTPYMTLSRIISANPTTIPLMKDTSRVTLVGDAIHAMPPTAAFGATTALQDVGVLADKVVKAAEAQWNVEPLREYEAEMKEYASASIVRSAHGGKLMFEMRDFAELPTITPS